MSRLKLICYYVSNSPNTLYMIFFCSNIPSVRIYMLEFWCSNHAKLNVEYTIKMTTNEPVHEISNNVVCVTSKASDQPAHTHSLIRAFASRLNIL